MFFKAIIFVIIQSLHAKRIEKFENGTKSLKAVHFLYRHGGRAPCVLFPKSTRTEADWPNGAGWLTRKGMQVVYDLGLFLRRRYVHDKQLISERYDHREVYLQSSDQDRCLQSAQLQMAGLFPPKGYQVWNKNIPWQPIPIHSVKKQNDALIRAFEDNCPRRDQIWRDFKKQVEYIKKSAESAELFHQLSNHTGMEITMDNVWIVRDTNRVERFEGLDVPRWADIISMQVSELDDWYMKYHYYNKSNELSRLLGGSLLTKMTRDMMEMARDYHLDGNNRENNKHMYKMNIYSGHDKSLLGLSAALDVEIPLPINFGCCLMVELYHSEKNGYEVQMYLHNVDTGAADNPVPVTLKGCTFSCPLEKFVALNKNRLSKNRDEECKIR